jgi:pimeloyl-ACP methyl ester carboxylesterase
VQDESVPSPARRPVVDLADHDLFTADGIRLSARHEPALSEVEPALPGDEPDGEPGGEPGGEPDGEPPARSLAFVVAHGFTGSWRRPDMQAIVAALRPVGAVIGFDFRGHGGSAGLSTVGDLEVADLEAAVAWARELGYERLVTVGWSMGAAVAVRHAALRRGVDAVVSVSGPSRWHFRGTVPMRLVHRAIESRPGRAVAASFYGTRIVSSGWDPPPAPPDAVVGLIAPTPLLIVHGDADPFLPLDHAYWLAAAAREPVDLWLERGFGHAETAASPDLVRRIAAWACAAVDKADGKAVDKADGKAVDGADAPAAPSARMRG